MDGVVTVRFSITSISTMLGKTPLDTDRNTFCRASATAKESLAMATVGAVSAKAVFADFPSEELQEKENSRKDRSVAVATPAKYFVRRFI